jgi:MFS family permease
VIFLLASTLLSPLQRRSGRMTDLKGRRPFAILIPGLATFVYLFMFFTVLYNLNIIFMFIALVFNSYLGNFQWSLVNSIVTDSYNETERISAFSTFRITSNAGIGVGLIFAGIFFSVSTAYFFLVPVIASLLECLIIAGFLKETMKSSISVREEGRKPLKLLSNLGQYRTIIVMSILFSVSGTIANQYETPATPIYFGTQWHIPVYYISALFAVNTAVVVFFQTGITKIFSRFRENISYSAGILLYGVGYMIFALTGSIIALAIAIVVLTIGESVISPISSTVISKIAPPDQIGEYFGINSFFGGIFRSSSAIVGVGLLQIFAKTETFAYYTLFFLILLVSVISYTYLGKTMKNVTHSNMTENSA